MTLMPHVRGETLAERAIRAADMMTSESGTAIVEAAL